MGELSEELLSERFFRNIRMRRDLEKNAACLGFGPQVILRV